MQIVITSPYKRQADAQIITIEQYHKKREQRRRRVSKRMLKRFPLFAVEEMSKEFPNMTQELFIADITKKTRKSKSFRKVKSPMVRQGRYWEMEKMLAEYRETGNIEYLWKAQRLRNLMYEDFRVDFKLGKEVKTMYFPSTCPISAIKSIVAFRFTTWAELDEMLVEKARYGGLR